MKLKLPFAILLCLTFSNLKAQNSPSSDSLNIDSLFIHGKQVKAQEYVYLVIRSKDNFHRNRVYKENKRLFVKTYDDRKMRGRLIIINDSSICLYNTITMEKDTFKLSEIKKIRTSSLITNGIAVYSYSLALFSISYGTLLISLGDWFGVIIGYALILSSGPEFLVGLIASQGKSLKSTNFNFYIHHTKGFKLKPSMVKYLYPIQ